MSRKKIIFLEQYSKISGGQKVLLSLINGFKDHYECCVVVPEKGDLTKELENLKITYAIFPMGYYSLGKKTPFDIFNYLFRLPYLIQKLTKLIKEKDIGLVYANGARSFVWGTIACNLTNTSIVWHIHSIFATGIIRKLCIFFGKNRIVKKIIVVSRAVKEPLFAIGGKIELIYNAVDTKLYFPRENKYGPLRKELKIMSNPLIGIVGFLMEWKGVDDLIRAAKKVSSSHPQAKFAIIGDILYDIKGQRYKKYLKGLVNKLNLNNNVIFVGYRKDIPEIMKELDVFVLASKKPDPCPTSLIQAMASGVAVIATNFGGPAEIIRNNEDGLLYTSQNYTELAEKISFLLNNPKKMTDISHNACKKIKENYNQIDYLRRIKRIIDSSFLK
ncbi:glycosyltransferase family 4 protein [Candidatus Omnitrophota bacterium]